MERYLIALSFGPVQSLIGAARRTRDLWCGSWLLSEAARAAAKVLHETHANCLIFPHLENADTDLAPQDGPTDGANMSNVLRAEIRSGDAGTVRDLCDRAKNAASVRLRTLGDRARRKIQVREEVWNAQIDEVLESYVAWVAFRGDDYQKASRKLGAVLAARKTTRDFFQSPPLSTQGLPKSSLDGAMETVLPDRVKGHIRLQLGLSANEQLDALGVLKRLSGKVDQFTPFSRIAADAWIETLSEEQQRRLGEAYEPLVTLGRATRVSGNAGAYNALPFDAQMLYPPRLEAELSKTEGEDRQAAEELKNCLRQVRRDSAVGEPVPYAAILKADGDRMGELLSRARTVEHSRRISRALDSFASQVRQIVRDHRGHVIYSGGDDVLALLPLTQAVGCAKKLAERFESSLAPFASEMTAPNANRPTLSAGLGIGHVMQPLGALRDRAERAEKLAKGDGVKARNALAIVLGARAGSEHQLRIRWDDLQALEDLERTTMAFREKEISSRVAYDLRAIDLRLAWLREDDSCRAIGMRKAEIRRLLSRARRPAKGAVDKHIPDQVRALIERRVETDPLAGVADMLVIARWLAARTAADVGER